MKKVIENNGTWKCAHGEAIKKGLKMCEFVLHRRTNALPHESLITSIIHFMNGASEDIPTGYIFYNFL